MSDDPKAMRGPELDDVLGRAFLGLTVAGAGADMLGGLGRGGQVLGNVLMADALFRASDAIMRGPQPDRRKGPTLGL